MADYYEVLGVDRNADENTIKKAYRKLAMQYHPDRNPDDKAAEEKFKEVGEAYEVLSNPDKRAAYDRMGHEAFKNGGMGGAGGPGGAGFDPMDIFAQFFGGMGGGFGGFGGGRRKADPSQPGEDLRCNISLTLEEAAAGCSKKLRIDHLRPCEKCGGHGSADGKSGVKTCPTCHGSGMVTRQSSFIIQQTICPTCHGTGHTVTNPCSACRGDGRVEKKDQFTIPIQAGVETGMRLRVPGAGDCGLHGGPDGDLIVFIEVKKHPIFDREGRDLICTVPISLQDAIMGGTVTVPSLEGGVKVKLAPGTNSGTVQRVRGKGMPSTQFGGKGDLHVEFQVEMPTKLTSAQRKALEAFTATLTADNYPGIKTFTGLAQQHLK
ncbi:MAG: molecular chaperone DnaJ [Akkermansiaceae bacterium]|nr:molecular chaperone DnaJ [Akkermansiaceae bacterium]